MPAAARETHTLEGYVVTPDGITPGRIEFGELIRAIRAAATGAPPARFILPGFIDTHVHGGGGGDTMDGPDGVRRLARFHATHGTTTLLPTTITSPWPDVLRALRGVAQVRQEGAPLGADIPGAHLEGPFISPARLGAQPPHALNPTPDLLREALNLNVVRVVTLAPELPGAEDAAATFARAGVRVSLGHTAGTYEDAARIAQAVREAGGVLGGTHLFNAMGGIQGREPGVPGYLLADPHAHAELILDGHHVHTGSFLAAHAALRERLLLITDAIRATGMGDGETELGGQTVHVHAGRATLQGGTLAGSVLTLDAALRHAVTAGISLPDAAHLLAGAPADYLGLTDRGRIHAGLRADLTVLDQELNVQEVWVAGERVHTREHLRA